MLVRARIWLFALLIASALPRAHAQLLIIEFSDSHAQYNRALNFIKSVSKLSQDFKREHPEGTVLIIANGDVTGKSLWSEIDEGQNVYSLLEAFSKTKKISLTLGNHEAFDYLGKKANELFFSQNQSLIRTVKENNGQDIKVIASNIELDGRGHEIIAPFQDVILNNGQKIRIIGGILNSFFQKSDYSRFEEPKLFKDLLPQTEMLIEQIKQAQATGKTSVTFRKRQILPESKQAIADAQTWQTHHPEYASVQIKTNFDEREFLRIQTPKIYRDLLPLADSLIQQIKTAHGEGIKNIILSAHVPSGEFKRALGEVRVWQLSHQEYLDQNIIVAFGGHDHVHIDDQVSGISFIDSKSFFDFSAIQLDSNFKIEKKTFYPENAQAEFQSFNELLPEEQSVYDRIDAIVKEVVATAGPVLFESDGFPEIKTDFKNGPTRLGSILASCIRDWAIEQMTPYGVRPDQVVAFFNSSSYREDNPIPPGKFYERFVENMYLQPAPSSIRKVTGKQLIELKNSLTLKMAEISIYSPQLSSNLAASEFLQIQGADHRFHSIDEKEIYYLALDPWLSGNRNYVPRWDEIFPKTQMLSFSGEEHSLVAIWKKYLPIEVPLALAKSKCGDRLGGISPPK